MHWKIRGADVWTMVVVLSSTVIVTSAITALNLTPADTVATDFSHFPQVNFQRPAYSFPQSDLAHHHQSQILSDIQQNHRFHQPLSFPQQPLLLPQHPSFQQPLLYNQQSQFFAQDPQQIQHQLLHHDAEHHLHHVGPQQATIFNQQPTFATQQPQSHFTLLAPEQPQSPTQQSLSPTQQPQSPPQHPQLPTQQPQLPTKQPQLPTQQPQLPSEQETETTPNVPSPSLSTHIDFQQSISDPEEIQLQEQRVREREQQLREQRKREQEEREQQFREHQKRQQQLREQEDREQQKREQLVREHQQRREQQRLRDKQLREQREKEASLREQREKEARLSLETTSEQKRQPPISPGTRQPLPNNNSQRPAVFGEKKHPRLPLLPRTDAQQELELNERISPTAVTTQQQHLRPKVRLLDVVPRDQLHLQNERQKLFQQLKDAQIQESQNRNQSQYNRHADNEKLLIQQTQVIRGNQPQQRYKEEAAESQKKQTRVDPQDQKQLTEQLQKQFQLQLLQRQDLLRRLKLAVSNSATPANEDQVAPNPVLSLGNSSSPLFLANGQKLQILSGLKDSLPFPIPKGDNVEIKYITDPSSITTPKPPAVLFDELTKGVLPPGADYEVIRHKQDGGLEEVGKLPQNLPQKPVTFVFLEEQPDGTVKVQGVRGNNNLEQGKDSAENGDVDSIIKKIQEGDLKLPPSTKLTLDPSVGEESVPSPVKTYGDPANPSPNLNNVFQTPSPSNVKGSHLPFPGIRNGNKPPQVLHIQQTTNMEFIPSVTLSTLDDVGVSPTVPPYLKTNLQFPFPASSEYKPFVPSPQTKHNVVLTANFAAGNRNSPLPNPVTPFPNYHFSPTVLSPVTTYPSQVSASTPLNVPQKRYQQFLPTIPTSPGSDPKRPQSNQISNEKPKPPIVQQFHPTHFTPITPLSPVRVSQEADIPSNQVHTQDLPRYHNVVTLKTPRTPVKAIPHNHEDHRTVGEEVGELQQETRHAALSLTQILKRDGLYAMAKFLRESGLDNILNDTGPYTVFAPTDKAFRALLIQLGGPEKAEEKFRENPRLLSGLLLHHVIPGSFLMNSLQDEMTGVSLAGTQLRVNTYNTQDVEWNDVKVVTVNGARITRDKHDIAVPQGVAHAVDRVMFPLPVGTVLQTLESDRERRFTKFLKVLHASDLTSTLTGGRIFTVFAPINRAFNLITSEDLDRIVSDRDMARTLILRHLVPGSLYSAGMRFYQVKESMEKGYPITLTKNAGLVKVNNVQVVTHNVPSTNGVIHAIDGLL